MADHGSDDLGKPTDYLANERTYLAWVRTGVTFIALGFVVVKFGLLIRELTVRGQPVSGHASAPIGIALVLLGGLLIVLARLRYGEAEQAIRRGAYHPQPFLINALTLGVVLMAILLAAYLASTS